MYYLYKKMFVIMCILYAYYELARQNQCFEINKEILHKY